eukprot:c46750_g1_i1 orf=94-258(-)
MTEPLTFLHKSGGCLNGVGAITGFSLPSSLIPGYDVSNDYQHASSLVDGMVFAY